MRSFVTIIVFFLALSIYSNPQLISNVHVGNKASRLDSLILNIYPNPLKNNRLFIKSSAEGIKHIQIYNVLGEKKYETQTYEDHILLDELTTGIYIFKLEQEGQKVLKRLIIP